jgi:hypothetical protein
VKLEVPQFYGPRSTYLLANKWLLNSSKVLERREKHVSILLSSNIFNKISELFSESCKNFIFILN